MKRLPPHKTQNIDASPREDSHVCLLSKNQSPRSNRKHHHVGTAPATAPEAWNTTFFLLKLLFFSAYFPSPCPRLWPPFLLPQDPFLVTFTTPLSGYYSIKSRVRFKDSEQAQMGGKFRQLRSNQSSCQLPSLFEADECPLLQSSSVNYSQRGGHIPSAQHMPSLQDCLLFPALQVVAIAREFLRDWKDWG